MDPKRQQSEVPFKQVALSGKPITQQFQTQQPSVSSKLFKSQQTNESKGQSIPKQIPQEKSQSNSLFFMPESNDDIRVLNPRKNILSFQEEFDEFKTVQNFKALQDSNEFTEQSFPLDNSSQLSMDFLKDLSKNQNSKFIYVDPFQRTKEHTKQVQADDEFEQFLNQQQDSLKLCSEQLQEMLLDDQREQSNPSGQGGVEQTLFQVNTRSLGSALPQFGLDEYEISDINQGDVDLMDSVLSYLIDTECQNNHSIISGQNHLPQIPEEADDLIFEETFDIREYQMELYRKGRGKNCIIYLETGTGKTLVIMMLMWHQLCTIPDKKVIFLGNTIQLVEQQARQMKLKLSRVAFLLEDQYPDIQDYKSIITLIPFIEFCNKVAKEIRVIHGQKFPDNWNKVRWKLLLDKSTIFFMTPQVFLNCLRKGLISLTQISFIAFDECHCAQNNNPYNCIMKEFYLEEKYKDKGHEVPVVVGATASPITTSQTKDLNAVKKDLLQLSANLDSQYLYVDMNAIRQYLNEATIEYLTYEKLFNSHEVHDCVEFKYMDQDIRRELVQKMKLNGYIPQYYQILNNVYSILKQLADNTTHPLYLIGRQLFNYLIRDALVILLDLGPYSYSIMIREAIQALNEFIIKFVPQEDIDFRNVLNFLVDVEQSLQNSLKPRVEENVTPKLKTLLECLSQQIYKEEFLRRKVNKGQCNITLIFVRSRLGAYILNRTISDYILQQGLIKQLKCDFIVGFTQNNQSRKRPLGEPLKRLDGEFTQEKLIQLETSVKTNMNEFDLEKVVTTKSLLALKKTKLQNQLQVLEQFRAQEIQILISTSVAEEGLDIPKCNYVIGFSTLPSSKSFVQRKGRAREKSSKFLIMIPDAGVEKFKTETQQLVQQLTKQVIEQFSKNNEQSQQKIISDIQKKDKKEMFYESFTIEKTGAVLNTSWSLNLLSDICMSFNRKAGQRPAFSIYRVNRDKKQKYLAFVLLPMSLKSIIFKGTYQDTPKNAKSSAALNAVVNLYTQGYLTDELTALFMAECGYNMGASQNDSNIFLTDSYKNVMGKWSRTLLVSKEIGSLTIRSSLTYYLQQNTKIFYTSENLNGVAQGRWKDVMFQLITTSQFYYDLKQIKDYLELNNIVFEGFTQVNQKEVAQMKKQYIQQLKEIYCLSQIDRELRRELDPFRYQLEKRNHDFILLPKTYQHHLETIFQQLILSFKSHALSNQLYGYLYVRPQENAPSKPLHYQFQIVGWQSQGSSNQNQKLIPLTIFDGQIQWSNLKSQLKTSASDISLFVSSSINVDQLEVFWLFVGRCIYRILLSMQLYMTYWNNDCKVVRSQSKYYRSPTFIKNQLVGEHKIFRFLHRDRTDNNMISYVPGLRLIPQDNLQENDVIIDELRNIFLNRYSGHTKFSTQEITQFFFHYLGVSYQSLDHSLNDIDNFRKYIHETVESTQFHLYSHRNFVQWNQRVYNSDPDSKMKALYSQLQKNLSYSFSRLSLLQQALTDESYQGLLHQQAVPDFQSLFNTAKIDHGKPIHESGLQDMIQTLDKVNQKDVTIRSNQHMSIVGKQIYQYLCIKLIDKISSYKDDFCFFSVALRILQSPSTLGLLACKDQVTGFICGHPQNLLLVKSIEDSTLKQVQANPQFYPKLEDEDPGAIMIQTSMLALFAAVYIDAGINEDLNRLYDWFEMKMETLIPLDTILSREYIQNDETYRFYMWYSTVLDRDPADFNLIKIPHQDYNNHKRDKLYIPFDQKKGEIVNLLMENYQEITQLHFFATSKQQAWKEVIKFGRIQ